ncbi:MAG: hypothetical protein V1752_02105 [Candidatus Firestonebacteria bacterium]
MAMDKIAKISLAVSFAEHLLFFGIVGVVASIPAARIIPLIEVNLMNTISLNDMFSIPSDSGGGGKTKDEPVKNSVTPNIAAPADGKLLPPSEVGSTMEGNLISTLDIVGSGVAENVKFSGGKVSGFSFTGTGIITAKPDNVFIQFSVKSGAMVTLRSAEIESARRVDFLTYNLGRLFRIKKESFKSYGFQPEVIQQTMRQAKTLKRRDQDGNPIDEVQQRYNITKYVVVNDLGNKKFEEVCEILDKAIDYGAIAVAAIPKLDNAVESQTTLGVGDTQVNAVKGGTKLKFKADTKNPANQLVNYHFNEGTLEKLIKSAKDQAYKEAKEKVEKIKAALKFKESEMDISFEESVNASSDEEGAVTIKADVTAALIKTAVAGGNKDSAPAGKKGGTKPEE